MPTVAVILSGCGFLDGAEINESVLTLLALSRQGASYQCFAPDRPQRDLIDHRTGKPDTSSGPRNILQEAARIARMKIQPLSALSAANYEAVILPGGYGAAKNLCNFALAGEAYRIEPDVESCLKDFIQASKPAGFLCIAPALIPRLYPDNVIFTIGNDPQVAASLTGIGGQHLDCPVHEVVVDPVYKVASTPAFMYDSAPLHLIAEGIDKLVQAVLQMAEPASAP